MTAEATSTRALMAGRNPEDAPIARPSFGPSSLATRPPVGPMPMVNPPEPTARTMAGASGGALLGQLVAFGINRAFLGPRFAPAAPIVADGATAEDSKEAALAKLTAHKAEIERRRRVAYAVAAGVSTTFAAVGTWVTAEESNRVEATIGAALGCGVLTGASVAINATYGAPGVLGAALGAYLGMRRSVQRIA